jgi:TRAP-type C4-dicarboxylate transport system substrate-binding protein
MLEANLASAYPDDYFQTQNLRQFADGVKQATAGQVIIKVQSGGKLIKAPRLAQKSGHRRIVDLVEIHHRAFNEVVVS